MSTREDITFINDFEAQTKVNYNNLGKKKKEERGEIYYFFRKSGLFRFECWMGM